MTNAIRRTASRQLLHRYIYWLLSKNSDTDLYRPSKSQQGFSDLPQHVTETLKRLSERRRKWLLLRAANEDRRRRGRKPRIGSPASFFGTREPIDWANMSSQDWGSYVEGWERMVPPSCFCLDQNTDAVIAFFEELRTRLYRPPSHNPALPKRGYVDFREIDYISPAAALVLAAEFERLYAVSGYSGFPVDLENWKPEVRQVLFDLGFLALLGVTDPITRYEQREVATYKILPFRSGRQTNSLAAAELRDTLKTLFEDLNDSQWLACYDCLIEAMGNVGYHAYPKRNRHLWSRFPVFDRWWMTGSVDPASNRMTIICFDQGVSIPGSLPRTKFGEHVRGYLLEVLNAVGFDQVDDGGLINAAMEVSRTSTGQYERGLGLAQMRALIENNADGHMRIISRQGEYNFNKEAGKPTFLNRKDTIGGTLVEWELWR